MKHGTSCDWTTCGALDRGISTAPHYESLLLFLTDVGLWILLADTKHTSYFALCWLPYKHISLILLKRFESQPARCRGAVTFVDSCQNRLSVIFVTRTPLHFYFAVAITPLCHRSRSLGSVQPVPSDDVIKLPSCASVHSHTLKRDCVCVCGYASCVLALQIIHRLSVYKEIVLQQL